MRQVMARVRAAWVSRGLCGAWATWAEVAAESVRVRRVVGRVRAAWVSRGLRSAWSTWAEAAGEGAAALFLFTTIFAGSSFVSTAILSVFVSVSACCSSMKSWGSALFKFVFGGS